MNNREIMNVNKKIIMIFFILLATQTFSQMKEDVYFLLEDNHTEYFVPRPFDKNLDYITVFSRKEYEMRKNKIEEAKRNQLYYYNPESGRDNLKIKVPKLTFKVKSSNKILLKDFEISSLKLIDFDWIKNNSWKKIAKQPYDFKDIYFLYKVNENEYVSHKVGLTIVAY